MEKQSSGLRKTKKEGAGMDKKKIIKSSQANPWVIFFFVTIGTLMVNIDSSIINVALPTLQQTFDAPINQVQWVITIYLLIITGILPFIGKLSDEKGRKKFFIWGVAVFILGSVLSAFATSLFILIASRAVQGIGGAMIMGNVMGIVANTFPQGNRGKALGTIGAVVAAGTIIGPALGGLLIEQFGWRLIFWINVPLGILSIIGTYYFMPSLTPKSNKQKPTYDISGSVLFFVATATLLYFLSNVEELGLSSGTAISLIVISALSWLGFFYQERKASDPMVDLEFFKNPQFTIGIVSMFMYYYLMMSTYVLLPLYFAYFLEIPVFYIGLLMTPQAIVMIIVSPFSGWLSDRIGTLIPSIIGMLIVTLDIWWMISFNGQTTYTEIIITMAVFGIGLSMFASPNNVSILESLPASKSGIVGSLIATMRNFGQVTGTAVGILLFNFGISRFHGNYDHAMNLAFTVSVVIGFIAILLLTLGFKFKSVVEE